MHIPGEVYTSSEKYPGLNLRLEEHENLYYLDPKKLACKTGSGEIKRKLLIEENCFQLVTRKFILVRKSRKWKLTDYFAGLLPLSSLALDWPVFIHNAETVRAKCLVQEHCTNAIRTPCLKSHHECT